MGWWAGAILLFIFQFACIIGVMASVFRHKEKVWSPVTLVGYGVHGLTAVLALWMFMKAIN